MVEFRTRIYEEDNKNIIGAEVIVYSNDGDEIGSIQVNSKEDYDKLVSRLDNLSETYILKTGLQDALNNVTIDADTFGGNSPNDYALSNHSHGDIYSIKNHADSNNIYGLGNSTVYGHVKCINNLDSSQYIDGECLSAYQGKILKDSLNTKVSSNHSHGWETIVKDKASSGITGTITLSVNKNIKMARIYFNITTAKTLTKGQTIIVYTNATYGTVGGFTSIPLRKQGLIMGINNAGNLIIDNLFDSTSQSTGTGSYSITYAYK